MKKISQILQLFIVLTLFFTLAGSAFAEKQNFPRGNETSVTVMSYNIAHGVGEDGVLDVAAIAEVIEDSKADIVGLQEVDNHWSSRSDFQDQAKQIAENLGMFYIYAANLDLEPTVEGQPNRQYGTAILSKYPILDSENHFLSNIKNNEQRGLLKATINVKGTHLNVFNTHLALTTEERIVQINELVEITENTTGPKIIMGDLNAIPSSEEMKPMYAYYQDAFWHQREAYTYPANDPVKRIDYIFSSNDLEVTYPKIIETQASDHLPITAEVLLERSTPYENGK